MCAACRHVWADPFQTGLGSGQRQSLCSDAAPRARRVREEVPWAVLKAGGGELGHTRFLPAGGSRASAFCTQIALIEMGGKTDKVPSNIPGTPPPTPVCRGRTAAEDAWPVDMKLDRLPPVHRTLGRAHPTAQPRLLTHLKPMVTWPEV